ncbi:hypothetical protein TNCV_4134471 [Trichonephila clavipes]|nr:hypothetical protein TNCV_4134471 [Trichonephila clavipes]
MTHDIIALMNRVVACQRTCPLQGIPAHEDIFGNEQADNLAKEIRISSQLSNSRILSDADAIVRSKLTSHPFKPSIPYLYCKRVISTTIARLRVRDTLKR